MTEWTERIKRLTDAINAEVDDLLDITQHGPDDRAAQGLTALGEHLREAATDMIDVGRSAFASQDVPKSCSRPV